MALSVPCPKCSKKLKLPGREVLGKTAKCPQCGHRFRLSLPKKAATDRDRGEVTAEAASTSVAALVEEPPVGLNARYVPEVLEVAAVASPDQFVPPAVDPGGNFLSPPEPSTDVSSDSGLPLAAESQAIPVRLPPPDPPPVSARRRRKKSGTPMIAAGIALLVAAVGGLAYALQADPAPQPLPGPAAVSRNEPPDAASSGGVFIESPTRGDAVPLTMQPAGVSVLIHIRPADVWGTGGPIAELRSALPPSTLVTARGVLEDLSGRPVEELEEATLAIVLGARGVKPQVAGVFRTTSERELGEWLQSISGQAEILSEEIRIVRGGERATLIRDGRTFAVGPVEYADDLIDSLNVPQPNVSPAISPLLNRTDRQRHFTVVAGRNDLSIHGSALLTGPAGELLASVLQTLGEDADAALWSLHQTDRLYSEFVFAPRSGVTPVSLQKTLLTTIDGLPTQTMSRLRRTNPAAEAVRAVAGRYPAMLEAARLSTSVDTGRSDVTVRTLLPAVAGPNLIVGTVATYNVLAEADMRPAAVATQPAAADTRTLAERLKTPLDAEFARMPLQEAIAYIADETGIAIELDGDGLKLAGYTQNMPQTFDLGTVPAEAALAKILSQYEKMRLVQGDGANRLRLTTVDATGGADAVELPPAM